MPRKFKLKFKENDPVIAFKKIQLNTEGSFVLVSMSTFANCQNFTIGYFNVFLNCIPLKDRKARLQEIKLLCSISKALLVVDVSPGNFTAIKNTFHVLSSMPYLSSNNNKMVICIIDTRK